MNINPYEAPHAKPPTHQPDDIPGMIRYREFTSPTFSFVFSGRRQMKMLREEASAFINSHVGVDNVVSIVEHSGFDYVITVWYRTTLPR